MEKHEVDNQSRGTGWCTNRENESLVSVWGVMKLELVTPRFVSLG